MRLVGSHFYLPAIQMCNLQAVFSERYAVMYYKPENGHCIGIRQKFPPKKQIFSFGGTSCPLSEDGLRGWADEVIKKLNEGRRPGNVKTWIKKTIKDLSD